MRDPNEKTEASCCQNRRCPGMLLLVIVNTYAVIWKNQKSDQTDHYYYEGFESAKSTASPFRYSRRDEQRA